MKTIKYDSSRPLMRLEKGDKAIISVSRFPFANSKDKSVIKMFQKGNIMPYVLIICIWSVPIVQF